MRDWLKRNPVIAALALLAVLLGAVLAVEISTGGPVPPPGAARRAVPAEAKLLPPMVAMAPEQAYPETAARPLFVPTRRPAPAVVATPQQPTIQRNQFVLLGVTIAGETRIAMLRERTSGRLHRVEKGRDINGMKVAEIQPEMVTLAIGGEQEQLSLNVQKPGTAGQPSPAPVAAAQGPFTLPPSPAAPPAAPAPGALAAPQPNVPQAAARPGLQQPLIPPGPMPPGAAGQPGSATPPQPSQVPMTPEELLERRRARRAQQTQ